MPALQNSGSLGKLLRAFFVCRRQRARSRGMGGREQAHLQKLGFFGLPSRTHAVECRGGVAEPPFFHNCAAIRDAALTSVSAFNSRYRSNCVISARSDLHRSSPPPDLACRMPVAPLPLGHAHRQVRWQGRITLLAKMKEPGFHCRCLVPVLQPGGGLLGLLRQKDSHVTEVPSAFAPSACPDLAAYGIQHFPYCLLFAGRACGVWVFSVYRSRRSLVPTLFSLSCSIFSALICSGTHCDRSCFPVRTVGLADSAYPLSKSHPFEILAPASISPILTGLRAVLSFFVS